MSIPLLFSFCFANKITDDKDSSSGKTVALPNMCSEQGNSRFSSALASSQHNGNLDLSSSPNASVKDALMNSEACLFGKWFVTLLQEISLGWRLCKCPEA